MSDYIFHIFPDQRFIDLTLYQYGWEKCKPNQSFGPHVRNHYLFHFVIAGSGYLYTNDQDGEIHKQRVRSNQGFLISPHMSTTYAADPNHPWEYVWIEFDGLRAKELMTLSGLNIENPIYKSSDTELSSKLQDELLHIIHNSDASPLHLIGHLYEVMDLMSASSKNRINTSSGKLTDFYIHEAMSFIEQNYENQITIEDIADFCQLNRSYFGKIFKRSIGSTPQEFLLNYRMKKATELLKMTSIPIKDISVSVGYPNQMHFSRAFKRQHGISPRDWRSKNKLHEHRL